MKVSVVITTFNRAYIVGDAVESALAQTYRDFEVIVVDDGSTDNTREIVESYQSDKIRYIRHEENRGCSAAANTGIAAALGEFVSFLDSDDLWKPENLERQIDFFSRHPDVDIVFTDTEIVGGSEPTPSLMKLMPSFQDLLRRGARVDEHVFSGRLIYLCLLEEIPIKPTAATIRREMFQRVGTFDEAWPSGTDWDLFLRLSRVSRFGYIDRVFTVQRRTSDATHQKYREQDKLFLLNLFLKEKATLLDDAEALKRVNRGIGNHYNSLAWTYLQTGRGKEALSTYYQGFTETLQPRMLKKIVSAVLRMALGGRNADHVVHPCRHVPEDQDREIRGAAMKPRGIGRDDVVEAREHASASRNPNPVVSIVVPTFNRGYIIREALESALSQEYTDFEVLVVDDGSTDSTCTTVESFKDERIRYVRHNQNRGYSAACNTGIAGARGQFVAFLDSDDVWKADYLERQLTFFNRYPDVDVVFCDTEIQDPSTTTPSLISLMRSFPKLLQRVPGKVEHVFSGRQMYLCLLEEVPIKPTAAVMRRDLLKRVGGFDESWPSGTDWDVFLRLSRLARFGYIDASLVVQRRTTDATHQKFIEKDKLFLLSVFLKEKASIHGDREALRAVNRGLVSHYNSVAWYYLEAERSVDALSAYLSGFKHTFDPMFLIKAASILMPTAVRGGLRAAVRFGRSKFAMTNSSWK